jgi:hypothetical protein
METIDPRYRAEAERAARHEIEGEERVGQLPSAEFLALSVGSEPGDPVVVFIGWTMDVVENAYPGTAIWRAAVSRFLASPATGDPAEAVVRAAAADSLEHFPNLERWLAWHDHERAVRAERRAKKRGNRRRFWIGGLR